MLYVALSRIGAFDCATVYIAHWEKTCEMISMIHPDLLYAFGAETCLTANIVYREVLPRTHLTVFQDSRIVQHDAIQEVLYKYGILDVVPGRTIRIRRNATTDASDSDNMEDNDPAVLLSKYYKYIMYIYLVVFSEGK